MVTKKTRWLSAIAAVIMLVSMLASIIVPAGAEPGSAILSALQKKYDILQQEDFVEVRGNTVAEIRAKIADLIAQYNAAEEDYEREIFENIGKQTDQGFITDNNGNLAPELIVRYSVKEYYEEMGYDPDATTYYISDVEDWSAAAASGLQFGGKTLLVTNDIDFKGEKVEPLTANDTSFQGVLDGQGFRFIDMVINIGDTDAEKAGYKYGGLVAALTGGTIKNLGLDGGQVIFNGKDVVTDKNEGVGSFAGYIGKNGLLQNCWSTMEVINNSTIKDGKNGVAGLIGWGEGGVIDNCFFTGIATNNTADGAAADLIMYTANAVKVYNSIGAGTLNCSALRNPAAIGIHYSAYTSTANFGVYNSYGVGHNALRHRANYNPYNYKGTNYVTLPDTDITFTKDIVHKYTPEECNAAYTLDTLEEAVWAVNNRFDTTHQSADRDYIISIDENGELYMAKKEGAYRKVIIEGSASGLYYFKEGTKINLINDLNLLAAESITIDRKDLASALNGYDLTVPAGDITITITYSLNSEINLAATELMKRVAKYEKLNFDLFDCAQLLKDWVQASKAELAKSKKDLAMLETLLEIESGEDGFVHIIALNPGVYPGVQEYELYKEFNKEQVWAISTVEDWLFMVDYTRGKMEHTFKGDTFYLTNDIDFKNVPMAPLSYGGMFMGTIDGQGYGFENVLINEETLTEDQPIGLISYAKDCAIRNFSIKSGLIDASKTKWARNTGAFFGYVDASTASSTFHIYKCWNNAEVRGARNTYQGAGALAGTVATSSSMTDILINGFYNSGNITSNSSHSGELYVGVIHPATTFYCASGVFNCLNSGVLGGIANPTDTSRGPMFVRVKPSVKNSTKFGNNAVLRSDKVNETPVVRYHITDDAVPYGQVSILEQGAYESGEMGYVLNQGNKGLVDQHGRAVTPVYYTFDADGRIAFGADDGSDQIRKITLKGKWNEVLYYPQGKVLDLETIVVGAGLSVAEAAFASALVGNKLTVPAGDVTINVTGDVLLDGPEFQEAKAKLYRYLSYNPDAYINGAELAALQDQIRDILKADEATNDPVVKKETLDFAKDITLIPDIKNTDSYFIPYSKKDTDFAGIKAKNQYGIFDMDDWNAVMAEGTDFSGTTLNLFADLAVAEGDGFAAFAGIFNGNDHTISGINVVANEGTTFGFFGNAIGRINGLTLKGQMKIALGTAKSPIDSAVYVGAFVGDSTAKITNCFNQVKIDVEAYTTSNVYVGGIAGKAVKFNNSANEAAISVTASAQAIYVGGITGEATGEMAYVSNVGAIKVKDVSTALNKAALCNTVVGGVVGAAQGAIADATNDGAVTVEGGRNLYVAGVVAECVGTAGTISNAINAGKILVRAATDKADVRYVAVGGIAAKNTFPMSGAIQNDGDVTVYAAGAAQAYIAGVAAQISSTLTATNTAAIYAGGLKSVNGFRKADQITTSNNKKNNCAENGSCTICEHPNMTYVHVANTFQHDAKCECSLIATLTCEITYTENAVTYKNGKPVFTHAGVCKVCGGDYSGDCTIASVDDPADDCTKPTKYTFSCPCGRDDETDDNSVAQHDWSEWADDRENLQKVRTCADCGKVETELLDIAPELEFFNAEGKEEGVTVKAGDTNIEFTIALVKGMGIQSGKLQVALPTWAENIRIEAAAGVTKVGENLYEVKDKAAGTPLLNIVFDAKKIADEDQILSVSAVDIVGTNGTSATVAAVEAAVKVQTVLGDADVDGVSTMVDAVSILNYRVNNNYEINKKNADVDKNKNIDINDAMMIVRFWMGDPNYNGPVLG